MSEKLKEQLVRWFVGYCSLVAALTVGFLLLTGSWTVVLWVVRLCLATGVVAAGVIAAVWFFGE